MKEVNSDKNHLAHESITKTKIGINDKNSDHNTMLKKLKQNTQLKKHRQVHFNLKNPEGQNNFKEMTSSNILTSIVNKDLDANTLTNKFLKRLDGIIHECFGKVRIKEDDRDNDTDVMKLYDQRNKLRSKEDKASLKELAEVEEQLAEKCAESNYLKIKKELKDIKSDEGGFNMGKLWKLRKNSVLFKKI